MRGSSSVHTVLSFFAVFWCLKQAGVGILPAAFQPIRQVVADKHQLPIAGYQSQNTRHLRDKFLLQIVSHAQSEGSQFDYFDVLNEDQFIELLNCAPAEGMRRSTLQEEKLARQVAFLELNCPTTNPAQSTKLIGTWSLAFCGVGRGLQIEPVRKILKARKDYMFKTPVSSVTLTISEGFQMRTEVVLVASEGSEEHIVEESQLAVDAGDVVSEKGGFGRYLKVTYLADDLLIVRGRAASEVYQRIHQ